MDPTVPGITETCKEKNVFRNNYILDQHSFLQPAISLSFFGTPVNNFGDMLFQVLSVDRLGELSFQLSLLKVQRREDDLSEFT